MADASKLLRALLTKALKKSDTEIEEILTNTDETAAENSLLELDRTRISELSKPKPGSTFQDGYAKGKKETKAEDEAKLKTAFEVQDGDTPLNYDELISHIVEKKGSDSVGGEVAKLTADDLKKLPAFQPIQREFTKQLATQKTELETKINNLESGYKKETTFADVSKKALDILNGLSPVLPKNAIAAEKLKSSFLNDLKNVDWELQDGVLVPVKDGKVLTDAHGNAQTLEELAKGKAGEWFDFAQNNGGSNAGNQSSQSGNGGSSGGYKPTDVADYATYIHAPGRTLEEKQAATTNWEAAQKNGQEV